MSKAKEIFLKILPMLIVLVSTAVFMFAIKLVIGIFYEPKDSVYYTGDFVVIQCYQNPSSHYYLLRGEFDYDENKYKKVASEHDRIHMSDEPLAHFILNETPLDIDSTTVKELFTGNGLSAYQFGEFVVYRLEGEYGVFAPLREYKESATNRKNDLYVVRQLMKNERHLAFELPSWASDEKFYDRLEKIEWYLDAEYNEDN